VRAQTAPATDATSEQKASAIIVVVPARDEAERIGPCLASLNEQRQGPDAVLLLLNNCTDGTETIARAMAPALRFKLDVLSRDLPPGQANAGGARRCGMALAARRAGVDGMLLTTDADAIVPPDWVQRNLTALRQGADVVCGRAVIDPLEATIIPMHLHADDAREGRLIALLDEIGWILDPDPHDPLPRHTEASGASLAVSVAAFDRVGGIPAVASGEDRAFVEALRRIDARIRHDPAIEVIVSGRITGRAEGGMADTIRRRMVQQDEFTDDQVEPACDAFRRYDLRRRARRAWTARYVDPALAADLDLPVSVLADALSRPHFGTAWAELDSASSRLQRRRVRFADLPAEIAGAHALLHRLAPLETMAAE
jgi:GT2 family glycosyltransferase